MNSKETTDPKNDGCEAAHICPEEQLESSGTPGVEMEETVAETEEMLVETLADRLAKAEADGKAHWDNLLRTQAELDNLRKRATRDVENAHKFALEKFATELLSVVDNLERALSAINTEDESQKSVAEGIELTLKTFIDVLAKFNVEAVEPEGQPFDADLHQAVSTVPNSEVEPNTVIDVFQKGYTLNGRLIRPAMVVVSKTA